MSHAPNEPEFRVQATVGPGGRTTVAVAGEVDVATAGEVESTVAGHLSRGAVLLDLREVEFLDSSGVRVLDALTRSAAEQGQDLRVSAALQDEVRQVLELTGLMLVLPLEQA